MKNVFIIKPTRTGIGSFGGGLSTLTATDLGSNVVFASLQKGKYSSLVDEVYLGNVLQAGNGQNPARQAALKAGVGISVPATTVNTVCGSGLHAVGMAYNSILAGHTDVAIAGGMESMSNAPYLLRNARNGYKLGHVDVIDDIIFDGLTCPINNYHMGITAENIADKYSISRSEQDEYAALSHERAIMAKKAGRFDDETVPITIKTKKEELVFKTDEHIKEGTNVEKLSRLRAVFKEGGTVTAGNSSGINDGAAAMMVVSENKLQQFEEKPQARIMGFSLVGVEPSLMGMGPVTAVSALIKKTGKSIDDIDLFELNEAFAVQSIAVQKELGLKIDRVNINGGAIALGHPLGASGARVLVTLIHSLKRLGKRYGVASLCIGSGMGIAMMIENLDI